MSILRPVFAMLVWGLMLTVPVTAAAETVYINDMLRVGIRAEPNSSLSPIAIVTTGEALQVLEKRRGYLLVETENGVKGWINDAYASSEMPARRRIAEIEAERERLDDEVKQWQEQAARASAETQELSARVDELTDENGDLRVRVSNHNGERIREVGYRWLVIAGIGVGLLLLGFIFGIQWYRRKVAARYGGLGL